MVDPELTRKQRPDRQIYVRELQDFKDVYGIITPWHTRISMYLEASPRQQDKRPFAYVYTVWQDENHGFHMFRERWVFHNGRWYTRVAGLIANRTTTE